MEVALSHSKIYAADCKACTEEKKASVRIHLLARISPIRARQLGEMTPIHTHPNTDIRAYTHPPTPTHMYINMLVDLPHLSLQADPKKKIDVIQRTITLRGTLTQQQRQRLLEIADMCPVHRTLGGSPAIITSLAPE